MSKGVLEALHDGSSPSLIPRGWELKLLKELSLLKISNGAFNDPKKVGSGYKLINIYDLYQGTKIQTENLNRLALSLSEYKTFKVQRGDLFFTRSSLKKEGIAQCNIFLSDEEDVVYECHMMRVRPNAELVNSKYLQEFCAAAPAREYFISHGKTTTMTTIDQGSIGGLPVLLPPLPEQQKIAAILTAVDDKLDLIARQISATQTLKQGLMQTLFTRGAGTQDAQGRWHPHAEFQDSPIGQIPQSWEARKLEELATENITYGVVQPGEVSAGGVPLVRGGDIKNGKIAANLRTVSQEISVQFKRTVLQGGELLVSLVGYPGETAVVPEELAGANIARQAGMIRTSSLAMSKFIHCYLASPTGRACLLGGMIGSAQQVINLKSLREVYVPMPAEAERDQISAICEEVFNKLNVLATQQTHYQSLKRGLMQKLLTGEWRVRVEACGYNP